MNKPLLLVITGKPASGKSTLAHLLSKEIKCPLISRDELKEGYINTTGIDHSHLDNSIGKHIYELFFEVIELLLSKDISIIVEAAFQDKLWKPKLLSLSEKANIKIIICKINTDVAIQRFTNRLLNHPEREKFHGDQSSNLINEKDGLLTESYDPIKLDAPTLEVDTTENYNPEFLEIIRFIKHEL